MLSIIIPIYNVEQTLEKCLQSIVSQGLEDCEVIMVDDGSPDKCGEICERWAASDSRFRVVHQQNSGLSATRNAGIGIAKGELLTFVDSDDYLAEGTLKPLVERMMSDESISILEYNVVNTLPEVVPFHSESMMRSGKMLMIIGSKAMHTPIHTHGTRYTDARSSMVFPFLWAGILRTFTLYRCCFRM